MNWQLIGLGGGIFGEVAEFSHGELALEIFPRQAAALQEFDITVVNNLVRFTR